MQAFPLKERDRKTLMRFPDYKTGLFFVKTENNYYSDNSIYMANKSMCDCNNKKCSYNFLNRVAI